MHDKEARPHVLHVVWQLGYGGLESITREVVNGLPQFEHTILALEGLPLGRRGIVNDDVRLLDFAKGSGHVIWHVRRLYRLMRQLQPTVVQTYNLAGLEAMVAAWLAAVPRRLHCEHGYSDDDPYGHRRRYRLLRQIFSPFVQRFIAISPGLESDFLSSLDVPDDRIIRIQNGVDTNRFRPLAQRPALADWPFSDNAWCIGTVTRLAPVKNLPLLVRAFIRCLQDEPLRRQHWRLVIAGDGEDRASLVAMLDQAGIRDLCWLPGFRDDVPQLLANLNCFSLCSRHEGMPKAVLEAMACELPVITTAMANRSRLVIDGLTGTVLDAEGTIDSLATSMARYADDTACARVHGAAGRARVVHEFSLERTLRQYADAYAGSPSWTS
jgi:sugar transferase (PEP-CTERM/EpsH1 system associated)